jgi:hypothetical protein
VGEAVAREHDQRDDGDDLSGVAIEERGRGDDGEEAHEDPGPREGPDL